MKALNKMNKQRMAVRGLFIIAIAIGSIFSCNVEVADNSITSTEELLRAMKKENDGKWFQNFTFKQRTYRYSESEELIDSTIWHEFVHYPSYFRIDRDIDNKHYTIYRNDSTYNFRNDSLIQAADQPAVHLLYKGGLYFMSLEESLEKLDKYGYDKNVFMQEVFNGEPVYSVGDSTMQFKVHADHFYCMNRTYTTNSGKRVVATYDNFKRLKNGWVEQTVTFEVDGVKRLYEEYYDIKSPDKLNMELFDIRD